MHRQLQQLGAVFLGIPPARPRQVALLPLLRRADCLAMLPRIHWVVEVFLALHPQQEVTLPVGRRETISSGAAFLARNRLAKELLLRPLPLHKVPLLVLHPTCLVRSPLTRQPPLRPSPPPTTVSRGLSAIARDTDSPRSASFCTACHNWGDSIFNQCVHACSGSACRSLPLLCTAPSGGLFGSAPTPAASATTTTAAPSSGGLLGGGLFGAKPSTPAPASTTTAPSLFSLGGTASKDAAANKEGEKDKDASKTTTTSCTFASETA